MSKNDVIVELFYDGVWNDITAEDEVFTEQPITIIQGQSDELGGLRPAQITMRLNNVTDKFRITNPMSPLYGKVGRNTPLRVTVDGQVRGIAEVNSWLCDETQDFRRSPRRGKAWCDITATGVLARVNKWRNIIRSPLYRYILNNGVVPAEYWPMEMPSGSATAPSANGGYAMSPVTQARYTLGDGSVIPPGGAPNFGDGNKIPGSDPLPNFQGGGTLQGVVRTGTYSGYALDWVMQFDAGVADGSTSVDVLNWSESGTYVNFLVNVTNSSVSVFHSNSNDWSGLSSTGSCSIPLNVFDGSPHHYRYQVSQDGGNYLAQLYIDSFYVDTADNFGSPMVGTVGQPKVIDWNPAETVSDAMPAAAGHTIVWPDGSGGAQPPVVNVLNGYAIERADQRMTRILFDEEGINFGVVGTAFDSAQLGPQKSDTLFNIINEIRITEDGLVYDDIDTLGILFKLRTTRYNQSPALSLYLADLPKRPLEVESSTDVFNVVTVQQRGGGEATARDDTGPLGTQSPPDGIGEEKQDINVNLYDPAENLIQQANWWLRRNTVNLPKYPQFTLDLNAVPSINLINVFVGSVIEIIDLNYDTVRLFVLGWTEVVGTHSRKITFNCKPDQQFNIGEYDSTATRYDLTTCTLNGDHAPNATTLTFAITDDEAWSSTQAYDLFISGELIHIPIGAMAARTGSGPYAQVATGVFRSANGVTKTLPDGSAVRVSTPGRWGII